MKTLVKKISIFLFLSFVLVSCNQCNQKQTEDVGKEVNNPKEETVTVGQINEGDVRIVDAGTTLGEAQGEKTLSEAEATELRDELSAYDPVFDNFTPSVTPTKTDVDIDKVPPVIDINYVVWKILSDKYRLDMPENPENKPFTNELKRYQRNENITKVSGELDKETLEALYNDTDEPAFRTFLEAFVEIYFEVEDSRSDKKKPKKGERRKKFRKWLAGTLEEE